MSGRHSKDFLECPVCRASHVPTYSTSENGVQAATCVACGHFFKFKVTREVRSEVKFKVNGKEYTVDNSVNPATSLNEFLRDKRISMGTKYMCREGGCGLCVVMVTIINPASNKEEKHAINSCLCPVLLCGGWSVTTIEGLGNTRDGLHPIQDRLNKYNGSQCGFCSPGQIMNMFALLENDWDPSKKKIEDAFDGILCRCTGYRSILDAMKSFADDKCLPADIEDLSTKLCKKTGQPCSGACHPSPPSSPLHLVLADAQWFRPTSLAQLFELLNQYQDSKYRLVFGSTGSDNKVSVTPSQLLKTDMKGKVLTNLVLPVADSNTVVKFYKVAKRIQNSHCYVSAGIRLCCDKANNYLVTDTPSILSEEVKPDSDPLGGSQQFRLSLAINLFYRFALDLYGTDASPIYRSGALPLERPLSSGKQTYDTKKQEWPLTEPLLKLEGKAQVTGEAEFLNDIPPSPGELHAAFAVTSVGNAKITGIDISKAAAMKGVASVLLAKDIPGMNNAMPPPYGPEEVLCSEKVMYAGQAVAIVVADNEETAFTAAKAVSVTYEDVKPPILTIKEAVKADMIFPRQADDIVVGDAEKAISKAPHVITGEISCGTQYHFPMETQISICVPQEDGLKVYAASQWIDYAQKSVAQVLGVPCASIDVEVRRLGGAYGSKISRNFAISSACAVAAKVLNKPVRFAMNFHTNMENVTYYCDCGFAVNDCTVHDIMEMGDNAYYCPNWHMVPVAVQTNTPSHTYCRAPASTPGIFVMETIMQHVSKTLGKVPAEVKQLNLYKQGQVTPGGMTLTYCSIICLFQQLEKMADVSGRMKLVEKFNKENRWKKKGLSVVPLKYGVPWNTQNYGVNIAIYSQDGTIVQECYSEGIDLAAHSWFHPQSPAYYQYNSYGVTCIEVELDVCSLGSTPCHVWICCLTVEKDVGQVEGAFVMGIGYWLLEESIYDTTTGRYLTNNTWDAPNPLGVLRSKACGEPPLCMSCSVLFALKHAIEAARAENGHDAYFPLHGPATVEVAQLACQTGLPELLK
ncbi:XDH1-like protein [Mya arenaria]|uniref:XDH1-like protein n=1 Tax=Mya arenaria TaxID=6604 RepID=A0ABY7G0W4_MYAAR|nr:XDH1-like protein [Mya arenaria]